MASYGTAFRRKINIYDSAADRAKQVAQRQINRRLVVPLDAQNWMRAVEVLQFRRTKVGVDASHWNTVLRSALATTSVRHREMLDLVDEQLRTKEIASPTPELLIALISGYASRGLQVELWDAVQFAAKEPVLADAVQRYEAMKEAFRYFARLGSVDAVRELVLLVEGRPESKNGGELSRSATGLAGKLHSWIAEATAMAGRWDAALSLSQKEAGSAKRGSRQVGHDQLRDVFVRKGDNIESTASRDGVQLSAEAQRRVILEAGLAGAWETALSMALDGGHASVQDQAIQCSVLNGLGAAGKWELATKLVASAFDHHAKPSQSALDLLIASYPQVELANDGTLSEARHGATKELVNTFDTLSAYSDEMRVSTVIAERVCGALLAQGDWSRCLALLSNCDTLAEGSVVPRKGAEHGRVQHLVRMLYIAHGASPEATLFAMLRFPFLFPAAAFEGLPPREEIQSRRDEALALLGSRRGNPLKFPRESQNPSALGAKRASSKQYKRVFGVRPGRQDYFAGTKVFDADYLGQEVRIQAEADGGAYEFNGQDAQATARGAPVDYLDTASGWSHYGPFGGLKIYENSKRVPNPLSSWPKRMKALNNPLRGWNPKQNSSLAHNDTVKNWSGKSAL